MVALDEQHLHQRAPLVVELRRVVLHPMPARRRLRAGRDRRPFDLHRAQPAAAVRRELRVVAQVRDVDARREGRLHDGLARRERDRPRRRCVNVVLSLMRGLRLGRSARRHRRARSSGAPAPARHRGRRRARSRATSGAARRPAGNSARVSRDGLPAVCPRPQWLALCISAAELPHLLQVVWRALARGDLVHHASQQRGADPARRAEAAALVRRRSARSCARRRTGRAPRRTP